MERFSESDAPPLYDGYVQWGEGQRRRCPVADNELKKRVKATVPGTPAGIQARFNLLSRQVQRGQLLPDQQRMLAELCQQLERTHRPLIQVKADELARKLLAAMDPVQVAAMAARHVDIYHAVQKYWQDYGGKWVQAYVGEVYSPQGEADAAGQLLQKMILDATPWVLIDLVRQRHPRPANEQRF